MPLAALLLIEDHLAGERPPLLTQLAGQSLLERQILQTSSVGVRHFVVLAPVVPAEIVGIAERLNARGLNIEIARNAIDASGRFHPDEALIVIDGAVMIDAKWFELLARADQAILLTVPKSAGSRFERIDAKDSWSGMGRVESKIVRDLAQQLGDWSMGPTLLRRAVQMGAARISLSPEIIDFAAIRPIAVHEIAPALVFGSAIDSALASPGFANQVVDRHITRPNALRLVNRNITFKTLDSLTIILFLLSLFVSVGRNPAWAVIPFILACVVERLALAVRASSAASARPKVVNRVRDVCLIIMIAAFFWWSPDLTKRGAALVLTIWMVVSWCQARLFRAKTMRVDALLLAIILGISALFGHLVWGLGLGILILLIDQFLSDRARFQV